MSHHSSIEEFFQQAGPALEDITRTLQSLAHTALLNNSAPELNSFDVRPNFDQVSRQLLTLAEQTRQADYLVTFPSWYPKLTRSPALTLIYSTGAPWSKQAGGDNMAVYRLAPAENEYQNSIAGQQSAGYR